MTLKGPIKVVGCGLIGTSIALRLKEVGFSLILADENKSNLALATDLLAIKEVVTNPELVIIATPPEHVFEVARTEFSRYPAAIFIDVSGIKSKLMNEVDSFPELSKRYVSVHPMSGRETSGPQSARSDLFNSRAWLICRAKESTPGAVELARDLGELMGSTIYELDAQTHDSVIAAISHLPQILSSALGASLNDIDIQALNLAGQGLRDVSRLADSDPDLWSGLLLGNSKEVLAYSCSIARSPTTLNGSLGKDYLRVKSKGITCLFSQWIIRLYKCFFSHLTAVLKILYLSSDLGH